MKKKIVSLLLVLCMLLSLIPAVALTAGAEATHNHGTALTAAGGTLSGDYYLTGNVTLTTDITVASGTTLNLCLNGYVLKGTGTDSVIINNGTLNIYDCENENAGAHSFTVQSNGLWQYTPAAESTTTYDQLIARPETGAVIALTGGVITGGVAVKRGFDQIGGGIYSIGTLNLYGGTVCGNDGVRGGGGIGATLQGILNLNGGRICGNIISNSASNGGGISVYYSTATMAAGTDVSFNTAAYGGGIDLYSCFFTMNGGRVSYNQANTVIGQGGGIMSSASALTINGGTISNNVAKWGGGIYFSGDGDSRCFTMTGGTVTGNKAYGGGGVYIFTGSSTTLSGNPVVAGNTKLDGTTVNNLQRVDGVYLTLGDGGFTTGVLIGITGTGAFLKSTTMTKEQVLAPAGYFFSDDPSYAIGYAEESEMRHKSYDETDCWAAEDPSFWEWCEEPGHFESIDCKSLTVEAGSSITYMLDGAAVTDMVGAPYTYTTTVGVSAAKLSTVIPTTPAGTIFTGWYDAATAGNQVTEIASGAGNKILYGHYDYAVAQVGDDIYATVQEAIDAATAGQTVKLLRNVAENVTVASDDEIILDLNDKVLSAKTEKSVITTAGKLTIVDNATGKTTRYLTKTDDVWAIDNEKLTGDDYVVGGVITGGAGNNRPGVTDSKFGGGIDATAGTLTISGGNVVGNTASNGGGVSITGSAVLAQGNSKICYNTASEAAGGLYIYTTGSGNTVNGGSISNNIAKSLITNITGGGVYLRMSDLTVTNGTISNNLVDAPIAEGGGVYINWNTTLTLKNTNVKKNEVKGDDANGGGVYVYNFGTPGALVLENGTISGNKAALGAGVYVSGNITLSGTPVIDDNTVSGGAEENLYLVKEKKIAVGASGLSSGTNVGITIEDGASSGSPTCFYNDSTVSSQDLETMIGYFSADNSTSYGIGRINKDITRHSTAAGEASICPGRFGGDTDWATNGCGGKGHLYVESTRKLLLACRQSITYYDTDGVTSITVTGAPTDYVETMGATLPSSPDSIPSGMDFIGWYMGGTEVANITEESYGSFSLVSTCKYPITYSTVTGGSFTGTDHANAGESVAVTATPDTGYVLASLTANGTNVDLSSKTFSMPAAPTTVTGSFNNIFSITFVKEGETVYTTTYNGTLGFSAESINAVTVELGLGKRFDGWFTQSQDGTKVTSIAAGTTGDQTIYAHITDTINLFTNSVGGFTTDVGVDEMHTTTPEQYTGNKHLVVGFGANYSYLEDPGTVEKYGFYICNTVAGLGTDTSIESCRTTNGLPIGSQFFTYVYDIDSEDDVYYAKSYVCVGGRYYFSAPIHNQANKTTWLQPDFD